MKACFVSFVNCNACTMIVGGSADIGDRKVNISMYM